MRNIYAGVSLLALVTYAGVTRAAEAAANDATDSGSTVSELIVTGTRQTGVKAADSAAPIEIVGGEALKHVGQPDLIQTLSQNLPSFNAEALGADTANLTLAAALRGVSPNDTLVLVDGKRRHTTGNLAVDGGSPYTGSATTDLSFIPVAAIGHVEVLQDGAAAQYGSDAIAGVVNIILKNSDKAGTISATGGQYYQGDGATGAWSINKGFSLGSRGFVNITAEERYHDFSQRGGADRRYFNADGTPEGLSGINTNIATAPGAPDVNRIVGDAAYNIYNGFVNAGYDLGSGVEAYGFASYGHRIASTYENYRPPNKVSGVDTAGAAVYPFPYGFNPRESLREDDYSVTGGLKGAVAGWDWDLSTTYGRDKDDIYTVNSANAQLFAALQSDNAAPIAPQTNFYDGSFTNSQWTSNLDIDRAFNVGLASPLNVAFGAEARRDSFGITQGDAASSYSAGAQSYPGFQATDAATHSRTNYAGYIDFAVDPVKGLHVDLAGRYETYSDFGDTKVGKVTARYDFNPKFAIRGTVSTGFRAPTLAEEYYSATNVSPTAAVVQLPANSPAALAAGFAPLKPEKSDNYSIGFVAHPFERFQVTVDLYEIDIRDRILDSGFLLATLGSTVVSPGVQNAILLHGNKLDSGLSYTGISIFTNAANTRTRGVELTATYASDFGDIGRLDLSVGFNYNQTDVTAQAPLPAIDTNAAFGQVAILGPTALSALTTGTPREKAILGAYFTHDRWAVNLRETVYGETSETVSTSGTGVGGIPERIPVTGITDLDVSFKITPSLTLDIGANDLFDQAPPNRPNISNGAGGVRPADGSNVYNAPIGFSPWGIDGGYYYGKVTYNF